jgi:hypothetical protein
MQVNRFATLTSCLLSIAFAATFATAQAPTPPPAPAAPVPPTPRSVLDKGLSVTGLTAPDSPAWHLKANYNLLDKGAVIESGVFEESYSGPWTWHRSYTEKKIAGSEWSVTRAHHFQTKDKLNYAFLDQRVATPLTNPLSQAVNFTPEVALGGMAGTFSGVILNCIRAANGAAHAGHINPDLLFPMYCFDVKDSTLRYTKTSDTLISYSEFKPLGNRSVAGKVAIDVYGKPTATIEITLLEPLSAADQAQVAPAGGAIPQPWVHQANDPPLVPVKLMACEYPMAAASARVLGSVTIPVIIRKDGSVKNNGGAMGPYQLAEAASDCVGSWKFEPFKIDGEAVDVSESLIYVYDGKPFKGVIGYASQPSPPPAPAAPPAK